MTWREYYTYDICICTEAALLFLSGRLLLAFIVEQYVKIERSRREWCRKNQSLIRCDLLSGLRDAYVAGETDSGNVGARTVLPSNFLGGPRDMHQRFQDAMAVVQRSGKLDDFLKMTCNPKWPEIKDHLLPGRTHHHRPDLTTRVFRAKYGDLKKDILHKNALGRPVAHIAVTEFQKRGLPHVHMLLIMHSDDKPRSPEDYDGVVSAELPDSDISPELYAAEPYPWPLWSSQSESKVHGGRKMFQKTSSGLL